MSDAALFFANAVDGSGDSETGMRRKIYILSSLLAGFQDDLSEPVKPGFNAQTDTWTSLSHILRTGRAAVDNHPDPVLAVTGQFSLREDGKPRIKFLVATRHCSYPAARQRSDPDWEGSPGQRQDMQPEGRTKAKSLLKKLGPDVDYQQHVRDVLTILTYFLSKPPRRSSDLMNNLIDFTLVRTYRLQYLRFVRGDQLWGSNPIRWLHALWHDSDRAATTNIEEALTITDYFTAKMLRERAGLQSTSVDSKGTVFPFNSRNAHRWSHLLLKCLHQFERALGFVPQNAEPALGGDQSRLEQGRAKGERNYKYPAPPKPTKYKDVERARNALRILYNLIRSKAVVHLVPKSFAAIIRSRYDEVRMQDYQSGRYRTTSIKSAAQVLNTLATARVSNEESDPERKPDKTEERAWSESYDTVDDEPGVDESPVDHILRYIDSLAIPYTAPLDLWTKCRSFPDTTRLSMSPVTMIRQPTICMDDVSSLKDRIMQLKLSERQRDTVDLLFRPLERNLESNTSPKGTIHAAAALISVAYHNAGSDDIARAEGIKAHEVPIGLSKKCCLYCALLANALNDWRDREGNGGAYPRFLLAGSHGAICPWIPPSGLPREVLEKIRNRLWDAFVAVIQGGEDVAPQTSPQAETSRMHFDSSDIVASESESRLSLQSDPLQIVG